jgi:two-component system NarL family response regulator
MTIVAEANDGLEAITLTKKHLPDVVLLDLRMPRMDGLDVVAEVMASKLASKVIIMMTFDCEEDVHRSMKAGARGYLLKDSSQEEILDAIRRVNVGETYLPARIAQKVAEGLRKPGLSPRELEVLQCRSLCPMARGLPRAPRKPVSPRGSESLGATIFRQCDKITE